MPTNASNSASQDYYHTLVEGIVLCSAFVVEAVLIAVGNLLTVVLFTSFKKPCLEVLIALPASFPFREHVHDLECPPRLGR